jgi:hypothetical protein
LVAPASRAEEARRYPDTSFTGVVMKRLFALVFCAFACGAAVSSCGGGDYDASTDKLTIVGAPA